MHTNKLIANLIINDVSGILNKEKIDKSRFFATFPPEILANLAVRVANNLIDRKAALTELKEEIYTHCGKLRAIIDEEKISLEIKQEAKILKHREALAWLDIINPEK